MMSKKTLQSKARLFLIFALVMMTSNLFIFPPKEAKADAITCGSVITTDVTLTEDLDCSGTGSSGLIIGADNITINGAGHTITGTYSTPNTDLGDLANIQAGIKDLGYSHITIENLHVADFFIGIGAIGTGEAINNITIENSSVVNNVTYDLSFIFPMGIIVYNSDQNLVSGNTVHGFAYGIYLDNATTSEISSNSIFSASTDGLVFNGTTAMDTSTISDNSFKWSAVGLNLSDASEETAASVSGNTFLFNGQDINGGANVSFADNNSLHNIYDRMIYFSEEPDKNLVLGDTASFSFAMKDAAGNDLTVGSYTLETSPSETVTDSLEGNTVSGSFTPSEIGIYSLQITVSDSVGNTSKRNMLFYVDSAETSSLGTEDTTYYIRPGIDATHGQPKGRDERSMLLTAPTETETETCTQWVLDSVDQLPNYPFSTITAQDVNFWHKEDRSSNAYIYYLDNEEQQAIDLSADYVYSNASFSGLNWNMDYPFSWYYVQFEFGKPFQSNTNPYVQTTVAQPSTDVITHTYTTTPAIKSFSNPDVLLLAANQPDEESTLATLTLDGTYTIGDEDRAIDVTLDNYVFPFDRGVTRVSSDGTATLLVDELTGEDTYTSVTMATLPDSGSIDTAIESWNTGAGGDYTKQWTGVASASDISIEYTVGNMASNKSYGIYVDGSFYTSASANGAGVLTFNYTSTDTSAHDFHIGLITAGSTGRAANCSISINGGQTSTSDKNVSLAIGMTDGGTPNQVAVSNDGNFYTIDWSAYSAAKSWVLDDSNGYGAKTVYAMVKDASGKISAVCSAAIDYEQSSSSGSSGSSSSSSSSSSSNSSNSSSSSSSSSSITLPSGVQIGDLVKGQGLNSIYFIGKDNKRHSFPNETVFSSWYADFSQVKTVSADTLAAVTLGSNMTIRPGTYLIKIQSDPRVYAVESSGIIRWVKTEAIAIGLYGADWAKKVIDVDPTFFTDYQVGSEISALSHPSGSLIQYVGSADIYYIENALKRLIPSMSIFSADLFQTKFIIKNVPASIGYSAGADMAAMSAGDLVTFR